MSAVSSDGADDHRILINTKIVGLGHFDSFLLRACLKSHFGQSYLHGNRVFSSKLGFFRNPERPYTIQTHIIIIFSKPCQINDRDLVFKPDGLGESTATPQCSSQWIAKSTALGNNLLLFKTGS